MSVDPSTDQSTNYLCPQQQQLLQSQLQQQQQQGGNTRRHTVGPGDVAHEQAFGVNPMAVNPINFKFGTEAGTNIPINLPMLQNQPLHNFTIKDQHLLKPPTVMGASKWGIGVQLWDGDDSLSLSLLQVPLVGVRQMGVLIYTSTTQRMAVVALVVVDNRSRACTTRVPQWSEEQRVFGLRER